MVSFFLPVLPVQRAGIILVLASYGAGGEKKIDTFFIRPAP